MITDLNFSFVLATGLTFEEEQSWSLKNQALKREKALEK